MSNWGFHEDLEAGSMRHEWIVTATFMAKGKPHLIFKCRQTVLEDNDQVLRTEMLSLITLMVWRLQTPWNIIHDTFPVS